jgi:hypothetical protein
MSGHDPRRGAGALPPARWHSYAGAATGAPLAIGAALAQASAVPLPSRTEE